MPQKQKLFEELLEDICLVLSSHGIKTSGDKTKLPNELLELFVPVIDCMEQRYVEVISQTATGDKLVSALLGLWNSNEIHLKNRQTANIKFNEGIYEYATEHSDAWSRSKAYLDNINEIHSADALDTRMNFLKWAMTHFPGKVAAPEIADLITKTTSKEISEP
jgi:hypothetical protein